MDGGVEREAGAPARSDCAPSRWMMSQHVLVGGRLVNFFRKTASGCKEQEREGRFGSWSRKARNSSGRRELPRFALPQLDPSSMRFRETTKEREKKGEHLPATFSASHSHPPLLHAQPLPGPLSSPASPSAFGIRQSPPPKPSPPPRLSPLPPSSPAPSASQTPVHPQHRPSLRREAHGRPLGS